MAGILKMKGEAGFDKHGLTLIVTLVTAHTRGLKFAGSKLAALDVLSKLAPHVTNEIILERILTYIVSLKCQLFVFLTKFK